jgi:hypothetical protein
VPLLFFSDSFRKIETAERSYGAEMAFSQRKTPLPMGFIGGVHCGSSPGQADKRWKQKESS